MATSRLQLRTVAGPNSGDVIAVELGTCRLIGRHLSEGETAGFDLEGHRILDGAALHAVTDFFKNSSPHKSTDALARGSDVILDDDTISRAHAMVFFDVDGAGIIDLASTNGTYLNGKKVSTTLIKNQDRISMGHNEWIVEI